MVFKGRGRKCYHLCSFLSGFFPLQSLLKVLDHVLQAHTFTLVCQHNLFLVSAFLEAVREILHLHSQPLNRWENSKRRGIEWLLRVKWWLNSSQVPCQNVQIVTVSSGATHWENSSLDKVSFRSNSPKILNCLFKKKKKKSERWETMPVRIETLPRTLTKHEAHLKAVI